MLSTFGIVLLVIFVILIILTVIAAIHKWVEPIFISIIVLLAATTFLLCVAVTRTEHEVLLKNEYNLEKTSNEVILYSPDGKRLYSFTDAFTYNNFTNILAVHQHVGYSTFGLAQKVRYELTVKK
jgi:hypothetical protein